MVNTKRVYRLYHEEGLQVRTKKRGKRAAQARVPLPEAARPNQRWSMDFVSDRLTDGRWFRILTVVDQYTRECLCIHADRSQSGEKVAEHMRRLTATRGVPESITTDNGSEFAGQAMDVWANQAVVKLDFIRPSRPVQNGYIESFNGRLRDECLNTEVFSNLAEALTALQTAGLVRKRKKPGSHRKRRPRRSLPGMMLHIDGSEHRWFNDDRYYELIVILDDATSEIYYAQLVELNAREL